MNEYENHWDTVIENGPKREAGSGAGGVNRRVFKSPYGWMVEEFKPCKLPHADGAGHQITTMKRYDKRIECSISPARRETNAVCSWGPSKALYTAPDGTRATRAAVVAAHAEGLKQLQNGEGKQ